MGLDLVELTMEIEDEFGIRISDEDASKCETVGDIHAYLCRHLNKARTDRCVSMQTFFRLRRAFIESLGIERAAIIPSASIESYISNSWQLNEYQHIAGQTGFRMPPLVRPAVLEIINWGAMFAIGAALICPYFYFPWGDASIWAIVGALSVAISISIVARRTVWHPRRILITDTLGELTKRIIVINNLGAGSTDWTRDRIWQKLRTIVVEQLGVQPSQVVPQAHLIRDLGAN